MLVSGCGGMRRPARAIPAPDSAPVSNGNIDGAVARLDRLVADLMATSGVPGMAVAVVHGDRTIYAKGFGTCLIGTNAPVNADTVFQLASVSKSVGASGVAHEVGLGKVRWDSPVHDLLPWFALAERNVTQQVTIADLYAHRSGLPDHAGDHLEDMGFGQRDVLERLRHLPLRPFRKHYAYTNFGLTAAGLAAAEAAGVDWATLMERSIYAPLGMTRTSSRFSDFATRSNHVVGHRQVNGKWVPVEPPRMPDAQAPAASVTSSVNDMAKWLAMLLGDGRYDGRRIVDGAALGAAVSPQMPIAAARDGFPATYSGYGFDVGTTVLGRRRPLDQPEVDERLHLPAHPALVHAEGVGQVGGAHGPVLGQVREDEVGHRVQVGVDLAGTLAHHPLDPSDQRPDLRLDAAQVVVPRRRGRRRTHARGASAMSSSSRLTEVRRGTSLMKSTATSAPTANGRATRKM